MAQPPSAISAIEALEHLDVPGACSGIYFLCNGDEVVYVGQAALVISRVACHISQDRKTFDPSRVFFVPCEKDKLTETEIYWIKALKPKYNVTHTGKRAPRRDYRGSIMCVQEGRWSDAVGRLEYTEGKNGVMFFSQFELGGEVVPMNFMSLASPEQTAEWNSFMTDEVFYECMDRRRSR